MNKLDKIIFINKVFSISDTKRIMYGQGEELTLDETEKRFALNFARGLPE